MNNDKILLYMLYNRNTDNKTTEGMANVSGVNMEALQSLASMYDSDDFLPRLKPRVSLIDGSRF